MSTAILKIGKRLVVSDEANLSGTREGLETRGAFRKREESIDEIRKRLLSYGFVAADDSDTVVCLPGTGKSETDGKVYEQLASMIEERNELGRKISSLLKDHGMIAADDSPTQTDLP